MDTNSEEEEEGSSRRGVLSVADDGHDAVEEDDFMKLDDDDDDEVEEEEVLQAPKLYARPAFFRQTTAHGGGGRRASRNRQTAAAGGGVGTKILKTVTERYLRDDLGFGCYFPDDDNGGGDRDGRLGRQEAASKSDARAGARADASLGKPKVIETAQQLLALLLVGPSTGGGGGGRRHRKPSLIVCDTNVLLHNMDVLERLHDIGNDGDDGDDMIRTNIVIPQTALQECRKHRRVAYERAVDLLRSSSGGNNRKGGRLCILIPDPHHVETANVDDHLRVAATTTTTTTTDGAAAPPRRRLSPNDVNDARIRNVAAFYARHLRSANVRVVLLTDDKASRELAALESGGLYNAASVRGWVRELARDSPRLAFLSDLVAQFESPTDATAGAARVSAGADDDDASSDADDARRQYFPPHEDAATISKGIHSGTYHRGILRSVTSFTSGMVTIRKGEDRVAVTIASEQARNRAVDGDVVAIALNPLSDWISSSTGNGQQKKTGEDKAADEFCIASETADPSLGELENVQESVSLDQGGAQNAASSVGRSMRPTGRVVGIIRRNFVNLSGSIYDKPSGMTSFSGEADKKHHEMTERDRIASEHERDHPDGSTTCVFFPVDKKMHPVLIRTTQRERLLGQRIVVSVDSWPSTSPYPLGHYVRTIGPAGTKDVETQVLLQQHSIPHEPFSASVLACLPSDDYKIDMENSPGRQDLRHLPILSIDPPGCKDIDDALHCIELPNGNFQVGVHIADVTHYVEAGSAIDIEAASRSTSTYLVNKRLDMLPGLLTTDLCSLKGDVDRYAFSVLWEVTPEAQIVNVEFHKTIIHSIAALTYQQAQSFIDQPDDPNDVQACAVKRLAMLARMFRKRRIDAGALTLASPEVKFVLDSESLNPTDVQAYALLEANAVVEEFMLLANVTVAKKILRHYPTLSVLRRHPAPNRAMFDSLIEKARCRGFIIDIEDSKRLADSLDAATDPSDPYINKLLRILSTRCMSPAQYFCSGEYPALEWQHYGLAAPVYTHFTSPIRRYADVCVHRLLAAAIGVAPLPAHLSSKSYLHDICANMNRRHRAAQMAGRASVQLHTLLFFGSGNAQEEDAYVLDVETAESTEPSFSVMVPRYGIEGRVKLSVISPDDSNLQRFPQEHRIVYRQKIRAEDASASIQVLDKVRVRIWVREYEDHRRELVLDLLNPRVGPGVHESTRKRRSEEKTKDDKKQKTA